jgi:Fe2+ transport system protein B
MNQLLWASIGFSLFIVCPRMAGMANVISKATSSNLVLVSVIGTLIALPLIVAMVLIFRHYGIWAAMAFAVVTDLIAALIMGAISWKASLETFIIAVFVVVGVRVASLITAKVFH